MKLILTAIVLGHLVPFACLAQQQSSSDDGGSSVIDKVANFPTKFFNKISGNTADMERRLTRQTVKYIQRLEHQESRLKKKLYRLDSAKAAALYAQDPSQQYALLEQRLRQDSAKVFSSMGPEYLPYADSLQGALSFLSKNPALLNSNLNLQGNMQNSLAGLQQLQAKLQDADAIKQYIQSRKAQFQQFLSGYSNIPGGINSALQGYNKEAYYYADQVRQYRAMLNDPDKMMQTALSLLDKMPAFTSFMQSHSFLAGLFSVPAGYGTDQALVGMQTRDQVLAMIQSQVAQGGSGATAAIQNSLNTAQQDLSKMQSKLSKLGGGSGDMDMPQFKPNNERTKTFFNRLEYGMNLQTTSTNNFFPTYTDIGLSLGYKLNKSNTVGIGASYKLGWGTGIDHIAFSSQGVGLRSFIDIKLKKSFSLTGGYELNYLQPFSALQDIYNINLWDQSGLIGISKTISMKSTVFKKTRVSLLWDFLSYSQVPKTQPIVFRLGYLM